MLPGGSNASKQCSFSDSRYDASIDAFLGTLERHVSSGCHGAAEASAPSVLPLLAALPRGALFREEVRLRRLLASLWEGYALCNVPSRSADAAALLRAHQRALLLLEAPLLGLLGAKLGKLPPQRCRYRLRMRALCQN